MTLEARKKGAVPCWARLAARGEGGTGAASRTFRAKRGPLHRTPAPAALHSLCDSDLRLAAAGPSSTGLVGVCSRPAAQPPSRAKPCPRDGSHCFPHDAAIDIFCGIFFGFIMFVWLSSCVHEYLAGGGCRRTRRSRAERQLELQRAAWPRPAQAQAPAMAAAVALAAAARRLEEGNAVSAAPSAPPTPPRSARGAEPVVIVQPDGGFAFGEQLSDDGDDNDATSPHASEDAATGTPPGTPPAPADSRPAGHATHQAATSSCNDASSSSSSTSASTLTPLATAV